MSILKSFEDLFQMNTGLKKALSELKKSNPSATKKVAKHLFTDTLCPWVGNRYAYNDFLSRHKHHGIHVSIDLNSFSSLNNKYGHLVGDEGLQAYFKLSSELSRALKGKNFRVGGDENRLYFPDKAKAERFASDLKTRLVNEKIKDHQLSVSIGLGFTPEQAEKALKQAKEQLGPEVQYEKIRSFKAGEEPTIIVSMLNEQPPVHWSPVLEEQSKEQKDSLLKIKNPVK
jgi:diguanylate cyclase (GGDEF)-like protein